MLGSASLGVHSMDVQGVDTNCGAVNAGGQDEIARVDLCLLMSEKEMLRATLHQVVQATREVATCNSTVKNSAQRELVKHLSALAVLLDSNILQLDGLNLIMSEFYGLMRADLQMNISVQQFDTLISIFTRAAGFAFPITNRSILLDIVKTEAVTQARINFIDRAGQLAARAVRLTWLGNQYSRQNDMAEDKYDNQYAPRSLSPSLDQDFIMISEKDVRKVVRVLKISETKARFYLHYHDGADAFIAAFQVQSDASKRRAVIQSASSSDTVSVSNDGDDDDNESMGTACEDDDDDDIEGTVDEDLVVFKRLIRDGKALKESGIDVRAVRSVDPTGIEVDDQLIYNVTGEVVTIVEKHESWGQHFFKVLSKRDGPFYAISYNLAVAVDDAEYAGKESFKVYSESDATTAETLTKKRKASTKNADNSSKTAAVGASSSPSSSSDFVNWVCCDKCDKWRKLPVSHGSLPDKWDCSMASWEKFSCIFKRPRIEINDEVLVRRQQSNLTIAKQLQKNKEFVKLFQQCCTPETVTHTQARSAAAAAAAPAKATSSSSSTTSLLFDLKLDDILRARNRCLGPLNVDKLNQAFGMMENESRYSVFRQNKEAVYIALALTSAESELDSFISRQEGWLMDQSSGGRPHIDIAALSLFTKEQLNAKGEPGNYEYSWEVRNPKAFRAAALKVIGNADAPDQHKGHLQDIIKAMDRQQRNTGPIDRFCQVYVGESENVSLRLTQHWLLKSGTKVGEPMMGMLQKIKEEVGASCMVYQTAGLPEILTLIALSKSVANHEASTKAAVGILEVARTLLKRSGAAALQGQEGVPCLGLNLAGPGGDAYRGQVGGSGDLGIRIWSLRTEVTISVIMELKKLLGNEGPFTKVPRHVWDSVFKEASERTVASLYLSDFELLGMGRRINKEDDEVTLGEAQSGHSSRAG